MEDIVVDINEYKLPQLKSFFKVFSSSLRLEVLLLLYEKEWTVSDLAKKLGCSVPNISVHVSILESGGFVRKVPVKGMTKKILKPTIRRVEILFDAG